MDDKQAGMLQVGDFEILNFPPETLILILRIIDFPDDVHRVLHAVRTDMRHPRRSIQSVSGGGWYGHGRMREYGRWRVR